jgi:hypothetical protein
VTPTPSSSPDWAKESFSFLADSTKQLIAVATGVITVTVVFSKDLRPAARVAALVAWLALLVSVACGMAVLFLLSGRLAAAAKDATNPPSITEPDIQKSSLGQVGFFVLGVSSDPGA